MSSPSPLVSRFGSSVLAVFRHRWVWITAAIFLVLWFGHGPVLTWGVRAGLDAIGPATGVQVKAGHLDVRLNGPIEVRDLQVQVSNPEPSTTDIRAASVKLRFESFWRMFWNAGRVFSILEVRGLEGTLDVRAEALPPPPFRLPTLSLAQKEQLSAVLLRLMPLQVLADVPKLQVIGDGQQYTIDALNLRLIEGATGEVIANEVDVKIMDFAQVSKNVSGDTTWRNGALTVLGVKVREGVVVRSFGVNLARLGGIGLAWELGLFAGTVRGDLDIGEHLGFLHLGGTVSLVDLELEPVATMLKLEDNVGGRIRDARITYRGSPDFPMDSEIAVRLEAGDFRWNDRGWETLELGATYIGRRLYLSNFHLAQESNLISANGEASIPADLAMLPKTRFFVNLSADVRNVEALANLVGPQLGDMHGQLSLHGSLSGDAGELDGYLNALANDLQIAGLPSGSAKVSAVVKTTEIEVKHFEFWSGEDRVNAHATIAMQAPHQYSGDVSLTVNDLGLYAPLLPHSSGPQIFTGSAVLDWQGDGTVDAHSGAFQVQLKDVITDRTPTGLTGQFEGTYSPENLYVGVARVEHGGLAMAARLTLSRAGVNVMDLRLDRNTTRLLTGEAFLPLDVFALVQGDPLADALDLDRPVYAEVSSGVLQVAEMVRMLGQDVAASGTLSINFGAKGMLPELEVSGRLDAKDLSATFEDFAFPVTSIAIALSTKDARVALDGLVDVTGFQPMTVAGSMPFAFERLPDGGMRWFDENAPVDARLRFPDTSLEILRPFLPTAKTLAGVMSGSVDVSGSISEPRVAGGMKLSGGVIEMAQNLPVVRDLTADIGFDAAEMTIRHVRGEVGAGPFEVTGRVNYADTRNPQIQVSLKGDSVLIYRDPGFRLRADMNLRLDGSVAGGGSLSGTVDLVDGRIFRRLEITPLIVQSRVAGGGIEIPVLSGLVPPPWSEWTIDVRLKNQSPFLLIGNLATGDISPDLTFTGTFGNPTVSGVINLQNLQAYLPASDLIVPNGRISFTAENPFMPIMDVRGYAEVSGIRVQAFAYGPLSNANFAMRSDPPLSQENLILLVTTGVAPVGMSGAGLGVVAAGQGSILLLRSFARQLEPLGINIGSFVNRIGVSVIPPIDNTEGTSIAAEFRVNDQFSLIAGTDGYGFFNTGIQYTLRLR